VGSTHGSPERAAEAGGPLSAPHAGHMHMAV
jgi:hypothetical protein